MGLYKPASQRDEGLKIAMVRILAQAKRSPITVRYHGVDNNSSWLWSITNELGETLALQGAEEQVCLSMANW